MTKAQILVVEDECIIAMDIQSKLTCLGYGVSAIAYSASEAIKKAEQTKPDLVLMDIVLAGNIDGVEVAKQIRDRFDLPVIYLTGYLDEELLQQATTESDSYLLKPFSTTELNKAIENVLRQHYWKNEAINHGPIWDG